MQKILALALIIIALPLMYWGIELVLDPELATQARLQQEGEAWQYLVTGIIALGLGIYTYRRQS
ncbi:hypothetical protein SAMN05421831_10121 [Allopseudospirillum japonicum]|uniref:Uncharacterized protein n=1 Tax=Allopseudospirillum japonicum TaxID=64971 RepID=A0A1H6QDI5_9GAMM|nr:hypothetical protein [Allopseudospirillum japonicum]SEI37315.1 hypothetical protein SAMN05421831_10121 [Allopseudospirillum japonicum]